MASQDKGIQQIEEAIINGEIVRHVLEAQMPNERRPYWMISTQDSVIFATGNITIKVKRSEVEREKKKPSPARAKNGF